MMFIMIGGGGYLCSPEIDTLSCQKHHHSNEHYYDLINMSIIPPLIFDTHHTRLSDFPPTITVDDAKTCREKHGPYDKHRHYNSVVRYLHHGKAVVVGRLTRSHAVLAMCNKVKCLSSDMK